MADYNIFKVYYLETDLRDPEDKYIKPPLPIAWIVGQL